MTPYYLDLAGIKSCNGMYKKFVFDGNNIPRFPYSSGLEYNITFICHYALSHHSLFLKYGNTKNLEEFLHISKWIIDNGSESDGSFYYPYLYKWKSLNPPWISALGQGRLISVLARAYEITGKSKFKSKAISAMKPFEIKVLDNGLRTTFPDGGLAFEEYPTIIPNIVLNGLITSIFGLYDLSTIADFKSAKELFEDSLKSLEENLYNYDLGYWSAYDLTYPVRNVSSINYHQYHIVQLWALYEQSGRTNFKKMAEKWQKNRKSIQYYFFKNLSRVDRLSRKMIAR